MVVPGQAEIVGGVGTQAAVMGSVPLWAWVALGCMVVLVSFLIGFMIARFGFAKLFPPKMTIPCIDLEPVRYGANPVLRFIKYHPTTGWYHTTVDEPTEKDTIWVIERSGFLARTKTAHPWKKKDLIKIGEKNKGWAIHCPQYLYRELAEALDALAYENGVKSELTAELQYQVDDLTRNNTEFAKEQFWDMVKAVKELQPYSPPGTQRRK
jgi:hypothetical protein